MSTAPARVATSTQLPPPDAVLHLHCKAACSKSATVASSRQGQTGLCRRSSRDRQIRRQYERYQLLEPA